MIDVMNRLRVIRAELARFRNSEGSNADLTATIALTCEQLETVEVRTTLQEANIAFAGRQRWHRPLVVGSTGRQHVVPAGVRAVRQASRIRLTWWNRSGAGSFVPCIPQRRFVWLKFAIDDSCVIPGIREMFIAQFTVPNCSIVPLMKYAGLFPSEFSQVSRNPRLRPQRKIINAEVVAANGRQAGRKATVQQTR